jgi:hypothetical protein
MPPGHVGNYPMPYAYGHYGPSGLAGPLALATTLALAAPFLILAFLFTLAMAGPWVRHRIEARRIRSSSAAAARPAGNIPTPPVLASDPERDRTADRLAEAIGEGRLSFEEGGQRIEAALQSRYRRELERLVMDLPALASAARPSPSPHAARRRGLLAAAAVVVLAALVVQLAVGLWVLWPLAVASVATVRLLSRR